MSCRVGEERGRMRSERVGPVLPGGGTWWEAAASPFGVTRLDISTLRSHRSPNRAPLGSARYEKIYIYIYDMIIYVSLMGRVWEFCGFSTVFLQSSSGLSWGESLAAGVGGLVG